MVGVATTFLGQFVKLEPTFLQWIVPDGGALVENTGMYQNGNQRAQGFHCICCSPFNRIVAFAQMSNSFRIYPILLLTVSVSSEW